MSGWILGVDFGTSNTAAAHLEESGRTVQALPLAHTGNLMSSSVYVLSPSQIDVGDVAVNKASGDPSGFIAAPKRLLSLGQTTLQANQWDVPAHSIVAAVLRSVLTKAAGRHSGRPPGSLVLTHPEGWSQQQVGVLVDAAADVGYPANVVQTVSEPQAAAHYYARSGAVRPGERIAVFDFGAGTLDVAVLSARDDGSFDVVAAHGDNALGGRNFDAAIRRWVYGQLAERNPRLLRLLQDDAPLRETLTFDESVRKAKEILSEAAQAGIEISVAGEREVLSLTRREFESLIELDIARAVELTRTTFQMVGIADGGVRAIYLTGGSSRIPLVQKQMQTLGPVATLDDPKTVVAQGSLFAALNRAEASTRQSVPPVVSRHPTAGHSIAGHSIAGHSIAGHPQQWPAPPQAWPQPPAWNTEPGSKTTRPGRRKTGILLAAAAALLVGAITAVAVTLSDKSDSAGAAGATSSMSTHSGTTSTRASTTKPDPSPSTERTTASTTATIPSPSSAAPNAITPPAPDSRPAEPAPTTVPHPPPPPSPPPPAPKPRSQHSAHVLSLCKTLLPVVRGTPGGSAQVIRDNQLNPFWTGLSPQERAAYMEAYHLADTGSCH